MRAINMDFAKDLDYKKIIEIQRTFEKEGSFLGSSKLESGWRITIDLDKSNIIQSGIRSGDIIDKDSTEVKE